MRRDERDLLDVLKFELNFIEKGGYGRSPREPWRPQFVFEDSPTCMNYDSKQDPTPCTECVLMHLVPPESRELPVPCRQIRFNTAGETLDSLYRYADQREIEEEVHTWLRAEIARIENERKAGSSSPALKTSPGSQSPRGRPLVHEMGPKCANPACPTEFHWHHGGKFFRFCPDPASSSSFQCETGTTPTKHFWLCEHCCHKYTLVYAEGYGVLVKPAMLERRLSGEPEESVTPAVVWKAPR
jgi:hypothetical protein